MTQSKEQIVALVEEYRDRCLWFLRADYVPRTPEEVGRVLDLIERYGDAAGFRRVAEIRQWLLLPSKAIS